MMNFRKARRWVVLAAAAFAVNLSAHAQSTVVKVVVPFPAGGSPT